MQKRKLEQAFTILEGTGIWRMNYAPPLFRLLWLLKLQVPPPHFRSFAANALTLGGFFGGAWGLFMWTIVWHRFTSVEIALFASAIAGTFFGIGMASYYQYGQRKHSLPNWEALGDGYSNRPPNTRL